MWEFETHFSEVIQRTPEIKSFRFPVSSKDAPFQPGQSFVVKIRIKGVETGHTFSFSASPTDEGYLEFTKRITASEYSQQLNVTRPGDWARVKGPMGSFTLPAAPEPLCFVSGGIGITPLRSMLRYLAAKKLPYNVVLLYGNKSYQEIAFREELEQLCQSNPNMRVEHVLSAPDFPPGWRCRTGYITADVVREAVPDCRQRLHYISGPPKMVLSLEEQIIALGVPKDRVRRDSFTGYE